MSSSLPTWDLSRYFPSLDSSEFAAEKEAIRKDIAAAVEQIDSIVNDTNTDPATLVAKILETQQALMSRVGVVMSYVYGLGSVNTRDAAAIKASSQLQIALIPYHTAFTRFTAWLGQQDIEAIVAGSEIAQEHEFYLRNLMIDATHQMSEAEEALATELTLSGGTAWGSLQDKISSQILVTFEKTPGETVTIPMSDVRNLAQNADRDIRQRAYAAEIAAWKQWETPIAAALNGVKGEHVTVSEKRGWSSILESALHQNHIDQATLDAMMSAARDAFPDIRRYWAAKARTLGIEKLEWCDITAPVGQNNREWAWDEAMSFILEQFGDYSDKMRDMVQQAIDERWIDAGPREGKIGGAYCMPTTPGRSGVLSNYTPSFDGVSTMAHELGHAYHNLCQVDSSPIWRGNMPMTLAETASTFCETILRKAAIRNGSEDEKFAILEGALVDAGQIVVDITSRFLFEQSVIERRKEGELTAEEFCELMVAAQKETYGDAIVEETLHPYMWAVKSHYYSASFAFYNYPYMFGLLFGLGLYAQYEKDPEGFKANYDALLASTGSADAATLADKFGIDIRSKDFWTASLDVIREDINEFEALVNARSAN